MVWYSDGRSSDAGTVSLSVQLSEMRVVGMTVTVAVEEYFIAEGPLKTLLSGMREFGVNESVPLSEMKLRCLKITCTVRRLF